MVDLNFTEGFLLLLFFFQIDCPSVLEGWSVLRRRGVRRQSIPSLPILRPMFAAARGLTTMKKRSTSTSKKSATRMNAKSPQVQPDPRRHRRQVSRETRQLTHRRDQETVSVFRPS